MGFRKPLDVIEIVRQINVATYECNSVQNDGFTSWNIKQDLYQIKWILEAALKSCPEYSHEAQWLKEQEQKRIIKILKNEI